MKRADLSLCLVLAATLVFTDAVAQQTESTPMQKRNVAPASEAATASTAYPTPLPVENKKPGFFKRLFGNKTKPTPVAATPLPSPSPVAKRKKRRVTQNEEKSQLVESGTVDGQSQTPATGLPDTTPDGTSKIDPSAKTPATAVTTAIATASSTPLPDSLPPLEEGEVSRTPEIAKTTPVPPIKPAPSPIPSKVKASPLNQPIALVDGGISQDDGVSDSSTAEPATPDAASAEDRALEHIRFKKLKVRALEDAKVRDLKAKADAAASAEDRYKALKAYYPALFAQMRQIDSSFAKEIARMEAAAKRRLERMASEGVGNRIENSESKSAPESVIAGNKKKSGG